jgi:hypothetical protein
MWRTVASSTASVAASQASLDRYGVDRLIEEVERPYPSALAQRGFLVKDDWNDRLVVIDPRTNQVVWQYGVTGVQGSAPGYLHKPDGVDPAPPYSLDMTPRSTMGATLRVTLALWLVSDLPQTKAIPSVEASVPSRRIK